MKTPTKLTCLQIVILAVRGELTYGYVALDDFEFNHEFGECILEPHDAAPKTTTPVAPSQSTTIPQSRRY